MIDALIKEAPRALSRSGRLLMVHNSLSNFSKSVDLMKSAGLEPRVLAEQTLAFRPFIDRVWLDELGGIAKGLYSVRDGEPYETLRIVEATLP